MTTDITVPFKLANIIFEQNERTSAYPALYCRSTQPFVYNKREGAWVLTQGGSFDFTTYFNAFSARKWRLYTTAKCAYLHLELKGDPAKVYFTSAGTYSQTSARDKDPVLVTEGSATWKRYDLELPWDDQVLIAFQIESDGPVYLRNSYYYTKVSPSDVRPVELALASTTFKNERYVLPNIELLRSQVLGCADPIARHFSVHIVDNGRTLPVDKIEGGRIFIHPNPNAGGSGGFARGMLEALEQEPAATHVLLMDDDVSISPESLKRTYNLLSLANDEYADAFVAGAMLGNSTPDRQHEDVAYISPDGVCTQVKPPLYMSILRDVVTNESYNLDHPNAYAAWWYCCIPMTAVRRFGLPLPIFVRFDDVEYGNRCRPRIMAMNGICVWHANFEMRFSAAMERYQSTRNGFVINATTGFASPVDYLSQFENTVQVELKKYNYKSAELALEGFEDFLKGPDYLMQPGTAEMRFIEANAAAEKLVPLSELGIELDGIDMSPGALEDDVPRTRKQRLEDFLTMNGQRWPSLQKADGGTAVISNNGWEYPAGKIRGAERLVVIDPYTQTGTVRTPDPERCAELWARYKRDVREFKARRSELEAAYRAARDKMTSLDFWRFYLRF